MHRKAKRHPTYTQRWKQYVTLTHAGKQNVILHTHESNTSPGHAQKTNTPLWQTQESNKPRTHGKQCITLTAHIKGKPFIFCCSLSYNDMCWSALKKVKKLRHMHLTVHAPIDTCMSDWIKRGRERGWGEVWTHVLRCPRTGRHSVWLHARAVRPQLWCLYSLVTPSHLQ